MPYERQTHRILSGSLNLLPPGDKVPDEDARNNLNFRVDQAGRLQKRDGFKAVNPNTATASTDVHSLLRQKGHPNIFMGAGTNLWENNRATQIHSAFDGEPLTGVSYQDYLWIMNRGGPRKHDAARTQGTTRAWTPPAPTSAPNPNAGTTENKEFASFDLTTEGAEFIVLDPDEVQVYPVIAATTAKYPDTADPPVHWDSQTYSLLSDRIAWRCGAVWQVVSSAPAARRRPNKVGETCPFTRSEY